MVVQQSTRILVGINLHICIKAYVCTGISVRILRKEHITSKHNFVVVGYIGSL